MNIAILSQKPALYSTRRLTDTARQRGHTAYVINHLHCKMVIEQNKPQIIYREHALSGIDGIIPRIGTSATAYGASVIQQFQMMKIPTTTSTDALLRSRDKLRSLQLLSMSGLALPKTVFTDYTKNVRSVIEAVGGAPLVIKLLEGTQGLGVVLAESISAAESIIEAFQKMKARIIVQEFVKEAEGKDIRAFVVNGKVVAAMRRTAKPGEFRSNIHRGATAEAMDLSELETHTALKAAEVMGLGIAGVDMLPSPRGPLVLEVNASPGLEGIEKATGVDIASKIIDYLEEKMG